jgi:glucosamine 6-phosphate synthetase-like amidotransferase/phosphosugar isomerase protein
MCGIAGFSLNDKEQINATKLANALLLGIEERGFHATGAAWNNEQTNKVWVQKDAVTATEFIGSNRLSKTTSTAILHTRWATKGAVENNANNHPIDVRGIIGIHNGVIYNDDELFAKIGKELRIAQVDSEAIFANILHGVGEIPEKLQQVMGSAAVAWMDSKDGSSLHLSRISSSPVVIGISSMGSVFFASTEKALSLGAEAVKIKLKKIFRMEEGSYLQIERGAVINSQKFDKVSRELSYIERKALDLV